MFAQVVIESPLPQLDRVFEYEVPPEWQTQVVVGCRVRVTVGLSKKLLDGYVVALPETASFQGAIAPIAEVVSSAQVLSQEIYELCLRLSQRQASPVGELLRLAIPNRSVAVEKNFISTQADQRAKAKGRVEPDRLAVLVPAVSNFEVEYSPTWVQALVDHAKQQLANGSAVICVPDTSDLAVLKDELARQQVDYIDYSSAQAPSKRYAAFLAATVASRTLLIGNRNALFAPLPDLGAIVVWNESDFSHTDQSSPYLSSRDIALVRQAITGCNLSFVSLSLSTDIERLIQIGFLKLQETPSVRPKISFETAGSEGATLVAKTIRTALATGPVLVQVSAIGQSVAVYCEACSSKVLCRQCSGPLWLNSGGKPICRWCNALNYEVVCATCGGSKFKQGRAGATRSVAELGKAYPGFRVVESTSENRLSRIDSKPQLVVATPGCEPIPRHGYSAVVLMDAGNQLGRDSLRSVEDAVASWASACALLAPGGSAVLHGVGGKLAEQFVLWRQRDIAQDQLAERAELGLPPAVRLGSITGKSEAAAAVADAAKQAGAEVLGPTPMAHEQSQYIFKYPFRLGQELALELKASLLKAGSGRNARSSRNERAVRLKMDDRQVI